MPARSGRGWNWGSFDKVTSIAKHAVLREIGVHHHEPHIAQKS